MEWNIADLVENMVDTEPTREALVAGPARRTFAELDARANRAAHHLASAGVKAGDHVGIYGYNSVEWIESMLGVFKLRAVPININYRYVEDELRYLFDNADLVAVVAGREFLPRIGAVRSDSPKLKHVVAIEDGSDADLDAAGAVAYEEALEAASPERDFAPRSADDLYILYTGGTTGMPKGVMWRHQDVIFTLGGGIDHTTREPAKAPGDLAAKSQAGPPMTMLPVPPLMHGQCQWATLGSFFQGNRVVPWCERRFDGDSLWRLVEREKVQTISITGDAMARPMYDALAANRDQYDLSSLIALASSAAIFSPALKGAFKELFPNLIIVDSVGASETGFSGTSMYQAGDEKRENPGIVSVAPGRDTLVLDEETREPLPAGSEKVGKLARGGNVPLGYYKDPKKTAETFWEVDGKRYAVPGDFARVEADGSIRLLGRGSVCINSGGEKIFPEEVEAALKSHPDVLDALVVGVPDERWGQRVTAVVQARAGAKIELDAINEQARKFVAGYKVPRELFLVDEIVRSPSGKPDYPWAQKLARERSA
ncbi:MAG: acyl-CoA synthetase [Proteobacteria bacterium]|nr:acyl-CoA synthetase [Pseudomonadota bacterium]